MTKTVTISALRADSTPYAHHDVIVTLVAGSAGGVVGSNVIVEQSTVKLNASGTGSITLRTNDVEITSPSTSFYRFTVADSSPTITRSIRLTDDLPSSVSWTLAGIQVGDPTIPQRDVSSNYVIMPSGDSLTNELASLKIRRTDVAIHPVDTSGAYPASDIDPIADTAAWVTAGGPAFFNVETGDVVAINNFPFDPTTTGVYNWDGATFTRHPDYATTESLDKLLVVSHVHHSHFSGVPLAAPIPLAAMFFADDVGAPLGAAEFATKILPDGDTVIDLITYLGGGGGAVPTSRTVTAGTGLTGGGDLSADRTFAVSYGLTASTAVEGIALPRKAWRAGSYYATDVLPSNSGNNIASGQVKAMAFYNPVAGRPADQIAIDVHTGSAGSGILYICTDDGTGYPGTVVASGTMSTPTTSTRSTTTISYTLPRGQLWLVAHGTGTTWAGLALFGQSFYMPAPASYSANPISCWNATGAGTSALTSFPAGATAASSGVQILIRAA